MDHILITLLLSCRHFSLTPMWYLVKIWSFELSIFKGIHIYIFHMSLIGNGNTPKALIGCLSHPIDSNAPGIQLAMWLGQMKIFRTMLCTLCQNYYYIQYATMWLPLHAKVQYLHSGYQLLVNFMYFYCFRVFNREFLWPTDVNFNIIAWMPNVYALSNASRSNYLFLAQWRLVLLWKCCFMFHQLLFISYDCLLLSLLPWQWFSFTLTLYHKIHELFYLWCQTNWIYRKKLCNKCPGGISLETAVIVILLRSLALHRTTEPQEALWQHPIRTKYIPRTKYTRHD